MNADLTRFLVPRWLPKRTKAVKYYISFDEDAPRMTADEFWEFSRQNPNMRAELTKDGEVTLMSPTGFESSYENSQINFQLTSWANKDGSGVVTESNGGYILPNGATYAPDAAWTQKNRLEKFSREERKRFLPICPDFVIELLSFSDKLGEQQAKMEEYIENWASTRLANRSVSKYRTHLPPRPRTGNPRESKISLRRRRASRFRTRSD